MFECGSSLNFNSWAQAINNLTGTNEFSSFALARRITSAKPSAGTMMTKYGYDMCITPPHTMIDFKSYRQPWIDALAEGCGTTNSNTNALEVPQACIKTSE